MTAPTELAREAIAWAERDRLWKAYTSTQRGKHSGPAYKAWCDASAALCNKQEHERPGFESLAIVASAILSRDAEVARLRGLLDRAQTVIGEFACSETVLLDDIDAALRDGEAKP